MNEEEIIKYFTNCKIIFDYYGEESQRKQFIRELAELIQAITKNDPENFIEELADVQVMIDQFIITNHERDLEVQRVMAEKVDRQLKCIKEKQKNEKKRRNSGAAGNKKAGS